MALRRLARALWPLRPRMRGWYTARVCGLSHLPPLPRRGRGRGGAPCSIHPRDPRPPRSPVWSRNGSRTVPGTVLDVPGSLLIVRTGSRPYMWSALIEKRSFVLGRRLICSDITSTSSCPIASFACMSRLPIAAGATVSRASASTNSL